MTSGVGTEQFEWREPLPCSENVTRVIGTNISFHKLFVIGDYYLAALIGEETLTNLSELVLLLQEGEESLKEGFTVTFKDQEYVFVPDFIDR